MKKSIKVSRIRIGFQIGLHALLIGHILAYYFLGWSGLGSLEFQSFFHDFLGNGLLTAGALLMALALLFTLLFGRIFCSWGCHFGAFQDAAAWLLKKCGWRAPFVKTRFLHWAPYAMLIGIFLWVPARAWLARGRIAPPRMDLAANPPLGTLPGWLGSVVLFLGCGVFILFFLGTRGFCRFVCPYGASFRLLDPISPWRIRRVKACGSSCTAPGAETAHPCTLACPTAVNVHEEAAAWGAVRDRDCIRCHLCIEACPSQALSYTFRPMQAAAPACGTVSGPGDALPDGLHSETPAGSASHSGAPAAPRRPAYTLSLAGEVLAASVALIAFVAWDLTLAAHFLAGSLALGEGFLALLVFEAARRPEYRLGRVPLRQEGRWTFAGITLIGLVLLTLVPLVQGGAFKYLRHQGDSVFNRVFPGMEEDEAPGTPIQEALTPGTNAISPADRRALLERAGKVYGLALRILPHHSPTLRRQIVTLAEMGDRQALQLSDQLTQSDPGPWSEDLKNWVAGRFGGKSEK